jgi:phytoene dehydrogenase-like protein
MAVNKRVGGAADSFHTQGLAADIMSPDLHIIELSDRIQELGLPYDKLILEYREPDQWLHIQIAQAGTPHRYKVYTAKMDLGGMVYELVSE